MESSEYDNLIFRKVQGEEENEVRMYKSNLFQAAKKAQKIFEYLDSNQEVLQEWMKENIISACESLDNVCQAMEYEIAYPTSVEVDLPPEEITEESQKENNNFLTNEDKRFPLPQEAENGDQFIGRCISDPNMKNRYPEQSDRFMACMIILNSAPENSNNNPGEKFEDPMQVKEQDLDPQKPILP
jgi:hypothetical protein